MTQDYLFLLKFSTIYFTITPTNIKQYNLMFLLHKLIDSGRNLTHSASEIMSRLRRFRFLDLMAIKAENPCSHSHVEGKIRDCRTAFWANIG